MIMQSKCQINRINYAKKNFQTLDFSDTVFNANSIGLINECDRSIIQKHIVSFARNMPKKVFLHADFGMVQISVIVFLTI